jgi:uncharacterized protein YbjT (DUF2867 family)
VAIRAITRDLNRLGDLGDALAVTAVSGDMARPETLGAGLSGADVALIVTPTHKDRADLVAGALQVMMMVLNMMMLRMMVMILRWYHGPPSRRLLPGWTARISRLLTNLLFKSPQAAKGAKVRYVVVLSMPTADNSSTILGAQFAEIERKVKGSGLAYTIVRLPLFFENFLAQSEVRGGIVTGLGDDGGGSGW